MVISTAKRTFLGIAVFASALTMIGATSAQAKSEQAKHAAVASAVRIDHGYHQLATNYHPWSYCLDVGGGLQTVLDSCAYSSSTYTTWDVIQVTATDSRGGFWTNLVSNYGNCLDAENDAGGSPNNNGDHVNTFPCNGSSQQRWYFWPLSIANFYEIVNGYNTSKVLDARTDSSYNPRTPGDPVQLWSANYQTQQEWELLNVA